MESLSEWDLALLAASAYLAVIMLIRLMRRRRDGLIEELARQIDREQQKRKSQEHPPLRPRAGNSKSTRGAA